MSPHLRIAFHDRSHLGIGGLEYPDKGLHEVAGKIPGIETRLAKAEQDNTTRELFNKLEELLERE